jgi:uncharacterized protein
MHDPNALRSVDGLVALRLDECLARLRAHVPRVGRVAFVEDGHAVVLPVNYRMLDGAIVLRTGLGSKLEAALSGRPMSFQVDEVDPTWKEGWSIIVRGRAEELPGEELARAMLLGLEAWARGSRPRYLAVRPERITGRQIA